MGVRRRGARRSNKAADTAAAEVAAAGEGAVAGSGTAPPQQRSGRAASGLKPDLEEVLAAIESLYVDRLKPFGRILRKRLSERAAPAAAAAAETAAAAAREAGAGGCGGGQGKSRGGSSLPDIDVKHLLGVCEACPGLRVDPEEGGDWSAIILGRPDEFVDIYSSVDTYSEELWAEAAAYFGSLSKDDMTLPGGRYSCAQMLMGRELPFLVGFTLGQVCHFVQLAISKRKVLGYSEGSVVPYVFSQSMVKEQCAVSLQACATSASAATSQDGTTTAAGLPLATWDVARACLREILQNAAVPDAGPSTVPLSNVKRLFRSRYQVELSETALGHSKLSELLQDERFCDVCYVQLQGQGYIVVQNTEPAHSTTISLADTLLQDCGEALEPVEPLEVVARPRVQFCVDEPLNLGTDCLACSEEWGSTTAHEWGAFTPMRSPGIPPSCTVRRWGDKAPAGDAPHAAVPPRQTEFRDAAGEPLSLGLELCGEAREPKRVEFCVDEPLCFEFEDPFGASPLPLSTPLPSPGVPPSTTARRWPRAEPAAAAANGPHGEAETHSQDPAFAAALQASGASSDASSAGHFPAVHWKIHNTFVAAASLPATPLPGARRRAHSVPRDMGAAAAAATAEAEAYSPAPRGSDAAQAVFTFMPRTLPGSSMAAMGGGCDSTESTADGSDTGSSTGSATGLQPPLTPVSSANRRSTPELSGTPERKRRGSHSSSNGEGEEEPALPTVTPESTPVKVPLSRLKSLDCISDDAGLRTPSSRRNLFCPDQPLSLEDLEERTPSRRSSLPGFCGASPGFPRDKLSGGWVVQNTFIHAKMPPLTPAPGAKPRARSVPKDVGSHARTLALAAAAAVAAAATPGGTAAPLPPAVRSLRRLRTSDSDGSSPGINDSPAFVPPSPALMPPTPQTPFYSGSTCNWTASTAVPRACADQQRILRLSDYL